MVIQIKTAIKVKYIYIQAKPRYWEDALVNGIEDTIGTLIPCNINNTWCLLINIHTGKIENWCDWDENKAAEVSYKVCDDLNVYLLDENQNALVEKKECYVPDFLSPQKQGFGDYIYMNINKDGFIENWKITEEQLSKFLLQ